MNILVITDVLFPDTVGGAGRVAFHVGEGLSREGHRVHVITRNKGGRLPAFQTLRSNLFVHRFPVPTSRSPLLFVHEIVNSLRVARKVVKTRAFQLVCIHQSLPALGPVWSGSLRGLPTVYFFHSPWHEEFIIKKQVGTEGKSIQIVGQIMRFLENRILRRADLVFVLSGFMANKVREIHRMPPDRIIKIPGGVDPALFQLPPAGKDEAKKALGLPLDRTIFLTVRNLVPRMGMDTLISAFEKSDVLKRKGLLLIGGEGPLGPSLKAAVKNGRLGDIVQFLGRIPDERLPLAYQASDFFVLPTRQLEGFGLVIPEAMACGTPVIGTPVGAIPDVIGPFSSSLLFSGMGWRDIINKLEDVLLQPAHYRFSPQECRAFILQRYTWEKMVEAFTRSVVDGSLKS
jgi:glycosyltransferase involved in cell wall biosynthesis